MKKYWMMYFVLFLIMAPSSHSKDTQYGHLGVITEDLDVPWGMTFINPTTLLVTERSGRLLSLNINTGQYHTIAGLPEDILSEGQGGLLDIAVDPDSDWIYFTYSKNVDDQGATTLARGKLTDSTLTDWQDVFISRSRTSTNHHFGSRIAFDRQGHVFMSIGDRGVRENAQDLYNHAGTIVRLNVDGSVPQDNPFIADDDALNEIWSYGHRNPQGLYFNAETQQLWSNEHGPRGGDEINLISAGQNYGWPIISYGKEYYSFASVGEGTHKEGMIQPVKVYVPSIAPSSLMQYQGQAFPEWQGQLFSGALKLQHINKVTLNYQQQAIKEDRLFNDMAARIRHIIEGPDGFIYFSTDSGRILMLSPNNESPK